VKKLALFSIIPVMLCLFSTGALPQHTNFPKAPPPLNTETPSADPNQVTVVRHLDLTQLQQEANDLARTAQSIPTDLASVRKGLLPKDTIQKLKQIEKLSKRLRSELTP